MAIQAKGGAGGVAYTINGGNGGNAGQPGAGNGAGAAGTPPGGNGANGTYDTGSLSAGGGGGGADASSPDDAVGGNGGNGADVPFGESANGSGLGGGGGGGGGAGLVYGSNLMVASSSILGGAGGKGGAGQTSAGSETFADGGGGGGGGDGLVLNDSGLTVTIAAGLKVLGGAGGTGGQAGYYQMYEGSGGAGGDGGDAIFAYDGNTVVNAGNVRGGSAGAGGGGQGQAVTGMSGAGVIGSDMSVTNSGTIVGGVDPSGILRGNALTFTSGTNTLTLSSGGTVGTISGNIGVGGSLDIRSGGTASSLSGAALIFGAAATTVTVESGVTLKDDVSGIVAGDTLDFRGVVYSTKLEAVFTASATGGTLNIFNVANPNVVVATVSLTGTYIEGTYSYYNGTYTSGVFGLSSDGNGGTTIGFTATPALGMQPGDIATSNIPGSSAMVVVDRYNADYSLYYEDTITKASNGNDTFHFHGGSFFTGKSFAAFDNVTNSSGLLLNQTLYNSAGQATQQTQFNANGSVYLQDNVVYPAAGQVLYQYRSGSFFTGKSFSAFDNLATPGGTLLDQLLYNRDGTHTFTVPGSGLTLTAVKNDTFNVSGSNDTARFNATGFGADTFNGYKAGDIFSFSTSIFANYAALQQHLSGTSSAVITTSANDTLTLANVAKSSVTSSMFTFS